MLSASCYAVKVFINDKLWADSSVYRKINVSTMNGMKICKELYIFLTDSCGNNLKKILSMNLRIGNVPRIELGLNL